MYEHLLDVLQERGDGDARFLVVGLVARVELLLHAKRDASNHRSSHQFINEHRYRVLVGREKRTKAEDRADS